MLDLLSLGGNVGGRKEVVELKENAGYGEKSVFKIPF